MSPPEGAWGLPAVRGVREGATLVSALDRDPRSCAIIAAGRGEHLVNASPPVPWRRSSKFPSLNHFTPCSKQKPLLLMPGSQDPVFDFREQREPRGFSRWGTFISWFHYGRLVLPESERGSAAPHDKKNKRVKDTKHPYSSLPSSTPSLLTWPDPLEI